MKKQNGLLVLSKQMLEEIADAHTLDFSRYDGKDTPKFSTWKFAAYYLGKKVRFEWLSSCAHILGISVLGDHTLVPIYNPVSRKLRLHEFEKGTILLDKTLESGSEGRICRSRFTLMHECAHQILHQDYYDCQANVGESAKAAYSLQKDEDDTGGTAEPEMAWSDENWREWQANYLAGALLMPAYRVERFLKDSVLLEEYEHRVRAREPEKLAFESLVYHLACEFRVSPDTAEIRLRNIGFKRMPDQHKHKQKTFDFFAPALQTTQKPALESRNDEILAELEQKYLDPEYIFPGRVNKIVKNRQRRSACASEHT